MPIPTRARTSALGGYVTGHGGAPTPPPIASPVRVSSAFGFIGAGPDLRPQMNACAMQRNARAQYASRVGKCGAGPGRDRLRRARSAVRAGWRGGQSPGTVSGHLGEARRNVAKGCQRPEKRRSSEEHLAISRADFRLICGPAAAVMGIIRSGGAS
jgi:hypothetical protein